jgi:hypothetical protein
VKCVPGLIGDSGEMLGQQTPLAHEEVGGAASLGPADGREDLCLDFVSRRPSTPGSSGSIGEPDPLLLERHQNALDYPHAAVGADVHLRPPVRSPARAKDDVVHGSAVGRIDKPPPVGEALWFGGGRRAARRYRLEAMVDGGIGLRSPHPDDGQRA